MKGKLFAESFGAWERAKTDPYLKKQLAFVKEKADEFIEEGIIPIAYSDFQIFYETGSRYLYELKYFARRARLNAFSLLSLVYGEEKYIKAYENTVWAICDELSWAVPAHIDDSLPLGDYRGHIDLFAAETGFALAESSYLLGDKISKKLLNRLRYEIHDRIIESYLSDKKWWWSAARSNWAAVCAGCVGAAFLYLATEEEIVQALPSIEQTMSCFLESYGDDGACMEGYGYWSYGYGFFVYFAELLRQYSNGETDYFKDEKVKMISSFQDKILLSGNHSISFSDGFCDFKHFSGLSHFLHKKYGEITIPSDECAAVFGPDDHCYRWGHFIREYVWRYDGAVKDNISNKGMLYLKDAAWYIHRGEGYDFAAKAGHNGEPHNHNDVGSFLLYVDGKCILEDLGCGEYTADYFGKERYSYLVNSSRGHNLPIIDGNLQKPGKEYGSNVLKVTDNEFVVDIASAYGESNVQSLVRNFEIGENKIILKDNFLLGNSSEITERFISGIKPEIRENFVKIGSAEIYYDRTKLTCSITPEKYMTHSVQERTVFRIDFKTLKKQTQTEIHFEILFGGERI